jgi:tRNA pseudouridine55 synthase
MARRKTGRPVHGWLVLDKPAGMTSAAAVGAVRRAFNANRVGHAGTLDPLATGVLPIALGEATKTVSCAVDGAKHYRFTVRWGSETDTDDALGRATAQGGSLPTRDAVEAILPRFTGRISQTPPAFSAVKVKGARAYRLAREGGSVALAARTVHVETLSLLAMAGAEHTEFEARCGKGTYVRALARDMGRALGCLGHLVALRRTLVAPFDLASAVTLATIEVAARDGEEALARLLLPIEASLRQLLHLSVEQGDAARLLRGQAVALRGRNAPIASGPAYATYKGSVIALLRLEKGELHPVRVFHYASPRRVTPG